MHGMGRSTVARVINYECSLAVGSGLVWAQTEEAEGLTDGRNWTAHGEKRMKEVVRKFVTDVEWPQMQEDRPNLKGLSEETLEDPKNWPHAARMQLEHWFAKQMEETRRRNKLAQGDT